MDFFVKEFCELSSLEVYEILRARSQIFVVEKKMNCQDIDGMDIGAKHFCLKDNGKLIAYLRGFYQDEDKKIFKLGRILTLTHGCGHGRQLMNGSLAYIKEHIDAKMILINSQHHAVEFYRKFGFEPKGEEFLEEGVVHRRMELII